MGFKFVVIRLVLNTCLFDSDGIIMVQALYLLRQVAVNSKETQSKGMDEEDSPVIGSKWIHTGCPYP